MRRKCFSGIHQAPIKATLVHSKLGPCYALHNCTNFGYWSVSVFM